MSTMVPCVRISSKAAKASSAEVANVFRRKPVCPWE